MSEDKKPNGGLVLVRDVLDAWHVSYDEEIKRREAWWRERKLTAGIRTKGWSRAGRLLPRDIKREEIALIEPSLDWAQARLEQCRVCPAQGGACDVDFHMPAGKGTFPVWNNDTRSVDFRRCTADIEHQLRKRLGHFGIPVTLVGATFDNFTASNTVRDEMRAYTENFKQAGPAGFHFIGGTGTGKSHLAAATVRALAQRAQTVSFNARFEHVPSLLETMRRNYDRPSDERDEFERNMRECDLLVLDDLGAERPTEWVRDQLGIIVNNRWGDMRPLIVTSNKPIDAYRAVLGERTISRLRGMLKFVRVIDGKDQR